nr:MAG TPA: hypothetical protein [Microviridae sp.]
MFKTFSFKICIFRFLFYEILFLNFQIISLLFIKNLSTVY